MISLAKKSMKENTEEETEKARKKLGTGGGTWEVQSPTTTSGTWSVTIVPGTGPSWSTGIPILDHILGFFSSVGGIFGVSVLAGTYRVLL